MRLQLVGWAGMACIGGLGREVMESMAFFGYGEHHDNGLQQTCQCDGEARHEGVVCRCDCRVMWRGRRMVGRLCLSPA